MKKKPHLFLLLLGVMLLTACKTDYEESTELFDLTIALTTQADADYSLESLPVELRSTGSYTVTALTDTTDAKGMAHFKVPAGVYVASASTTIKTGTNKLLIANGTSGMIIVRGEEPTTTANIKMIVSRMSQLVIKEIYNGGTMKDDGKVFQADKCIILYNNSPQTALFDNLCIGFCSPYNSQANNKWYDKSGQLTYEAENYIPAIDGIWYFPNTLTIEPYRQVVVNCHGAIDNTLTYPNSVNYANPDYYCMYDPEVGYTNASYYPTPASVIPTSHYLKAVKIGISNAWALSTTSPAVFLFQTQGTTPTAYATDVNNLTYIPNSAQTDINKVLKVPCDWVLDGVEVFAAGYKSANIKRLTSDIDAGSVDLTNQHGHTLYRNVDKTSTEQLPENEGKLVYGYSLGVDASTDPSTIDAEASVKNGAHIVYMDTNNSTNDFHERQKCSLRN